MKTFKQPAVRGFCNPEGEPWVRLVEQYEQAGICVPAGYCYDGGSIPRFAWSVIGLSPFGIILGAATIHDWAYCNAGWVSEDDWIPKRVADKVFYDLMLKADIKRHRAFLAYWAVKLFGRYSYA